MKAFLLAAGHGTRLRPLTDQLPKCLLPIRGVPLLRIWLELCRRAGIDEVLVNLHAHADVVRSYLQENGNAIHIRTSNERVLLGSAGTVAANRGWVEHEPYFWVLYADVLTNMDLATMLRTHLSHAAIATLGVYQVPDPSRCGIVTVDDAGVVRDFVEKPARPSSNLAFSGILIGTPGLLEKILPQQPADFGYDVFPRLTGHISAYRISEYLLDIGTLENYQAAQLSWPGM